MNSLFVTSLSFCKQTQAAAFLRKSSENAISLRHNNAAMICFPRSVALHLRVRGILAINFGGMKAVQDSAGLRALLLGIKGEISANFTTLGSSIV
jgi:hypothetical protein